MYSPSSSSSDSVSSADSYDRKRHRQPHRSKSRKARTLFEDDAPRYSKDARKLSPLLMKHSLQLSDLQLSDEKPRSSRKNHSSAREKRSAVSRKELDEIKRQHEKELKNLLKFLEKESSLLNGIEEEKREELYVLKRQHEKEVKKLFQFQEKELTIITENFTRKQEDLEDRLERTHVEADAELRKRKEHSLAMEEELQSIKHKSSYEMRKLSNEMSTSLRQTSLLENEVLMLREQLAEKDKYMRKLEEVNAKSSYVEEELTNEIRRRDDELRRKDRTIAIKSEEIRSLGSRSAPSRDKVESININGCDWEESSGLTSSSDFDVRKDIVGQYREKPPPKYAFSPDRARKKGHYSSKRRDDRDDFDTGRLTVSFSDEVEKGHLPMQTHDSLSRRLEKMYLQG